MLALFNKQASLVLPATVFSTMLFFCFITMSRGGFEPPTQGFSILCSNLLSYPDLSPNILTLGRVEARVLFFVYAFDQLMIGHTSVQIA